MNLKELINHVTEGYGIFGTYLIGTELGAFGDLPTIQDGYMFYKVDCDEDVENVKNIMKIENEEIDELYPNADDEIHLSLDDYESKCFLTALLFVVIFIFYSLIKFPFYFLNKSNSYITVQQLMSRLNFQQYLLYHLRMSLLFRVLF